MGFSIHIVGSKTIDNKIFRCGYGHWNRLKKEIVASTKRYIVNMKRIFSKEVVEEIDKFKSEMENPIEDDIVMSFVLGGDKYVSILKETETEGIKTLINSDDADHIFSEKETVEISVSMKKIIPYVSSNKTEIEQVESIFSESAKMGKKVMIG